MRYWPNPAHKRETTEAGPPGWRPSKEPCPDDLTVEEREELLRNSVPGGSGARSRRYTLRRANTGLQFYEAKWHTDVDDEPEFHGHPTTRVPNRVLRVFRDEGRITQAEYRRHVRELG